MSYNLFSSSATSRSTANCNLSRTTIFNTSSHYSYCSWIRIGARSEGIKPVNVLKPCVGIVIASTIPSMAACQRSLLNQGH
ncbi:hypothetical protein PISMIDRAFT_497024 [Pisolithus microcarpus 441]|uniref:Unplaced genomic scaffold scaffold_54, whole genome shotgun sequence n=1 Tax=Pisolithus microcarpus 441 TaxID=765257 RepID=A0A0C9ZJ60_9AGAM|nr:hypothetical protein PISMIDRAFT_497024 [Pisolithus microcarpus 441]